MHLFEQLLDVHFGLGEPHQLIREGQKILAPLPGRTCSILQQAAANHDSAELEEWRLARNGCPFSYCS